jgi:hypothetical protein
VLLPPLRGKLAGVQVPEAFDHGIDGAPKLRRDRIPRAGKFVGCHGKPVGRQVGAIEALGQLDECRIPSRPDGLDDPANGLYGLAIKDEHVRLGWGEAVPKVDDSELPGFDEASLLMKRSDDCGGG